MSTHLQTGTRLGRYEIKSLLGAGGMGEVYLAEDTRLGRMVALKILHADSAAEEGRVQRFIREAKTASNLNHPNILTVYESDEERGAHYIVTEFVEGETLRRRIQSAPVPAREAVDVAAQVASALSAAHRAGVVHRDVKPENIMLRPDGYVKVLDFGIAKLMQRPAPQITAGSTRPAHADESLQTERGIVLGTVAYMSPEQARGLVVDARTDLWSLGVVLYEMLSGRAPFAGATKADVLSSILHAEPPPPLPTGHGLTASAGVELGRVVARALAKSRDERYQTSDEMLADLRRAREVLEQDAESARRDPTGATLVNTSGLVPRVVAAAAAAVTTRQQQGAEQQRRQVTILFADLSGLTELFEGMDAEELGDVMNALWGRVERVIAEGGGKIEKHMGDELSALWGAESAREDDPEHAIRAALALRDDVSEFARSYSREPRRDTAVGGACSVSGAEPLPLVRVGINTGPVLLGASPAGGLTATGAPVAVAKRLRNSARAGSVIISHDTYRHVRGVFDVQEAEPVPASAASGGGEAARAYTVLRAKPHAFRLRTRGVEGVETRMVGRKSEMKRLTDALETVFEDRELQAVTLLGDAGLGKSRLLYEFNNRIELLPDVCYVFKARAGEATGASPYALVRDLFSLRFEILDSDAPEVAREKLEHGIARIIGEGDDAALDAEAAEAAMRAHFIGHLAGLDFSASHHLSGILDDVKQIRDRAFHYAAQFFARVARAAPVLLLLDDLHWADDGSLDFIDHLARACADVPVMVLCAARPTLLERRAHWGEGHASHTRLTLQPLSKRESRQLVEEIMRQSNDVPQALGELVVARAEGNPFYVEEMIKMLIDQRVIMPGAEEWRVDAGRLVEVQVPPTLTGVLQARLDGLAPRERILLQRASVVGREFWDAAVEHMGGEEGGTARTSGAAAREWFQSLRRKELIYQRESSSFAGTCEYVFKHALLRDVTYETVLRRERRALHLRAAEWLAGQSGVRAGEYAAVIAEHYERAEAVARAAEWYGRAGRQALDAYAPESAISYFRKALALLPAATEDEGGAGDADASASPRGAQELEWYEGLGDVLWKQARLAEAYEAYEALRARASELGDAAAEARAWNGLSLVEDGRGDTRAALESAREAERRARAAGESPQARSALVTALLRQGFASYRLGDAASVVRLGDEALAISSSTGEAARRDRARSVHLLGTAHQMLGHTEQAQTYKEQSLALMRELGDRQNSGAMLNGLGETARLRGDYEAASRFYREALAIARETGNLSQQLVYLGNLGGARAGVGDWAAAEADLREVVRLADPAGHFALSEVYRFLAEALTGRENFNEALDAARTALALGRKTGNLDFIGGAWRALGLVAARLEEPVEVDGQTHTAAACFVESLRVFTEAGMDAERARVIRGWAGFEEARGDLEHAEAMRREAREIFSRLDMELEAERT